MSRDIPQRARGGFTLVEIMIVVVIIGLLAALALPLFQRIRIQSQNSRVASDVRVFIGAVNSYLMESGNYPPDMPPGRLPPDLRAWIKEADFSATSPFGGNYDLEVNDSSIILGVGIVGHTVSSDQLLAFDERYDDGNLGSGKWRSSGSGYYFVAED